jgi:hypothetical protein
MKIKFSTFVFLILTIHGIGQKMQWNSTFKTESATDQVYLGENNKKAVFFCPLLNRLLTFSEDRSSVQQTHLDTASLGYECCFLKDDQLHIVYALTEDLKKRRSVNRFWLVTFNLDGHKTGKKLLFESTDDEASLMAVNSYMSYGKDYDERPVSQALVSKNNNYLGINFVLNGFYAQRKNKFIIFETSGFKEIKTIDLATQESPKCILLNNGDLLTIQGDSRSIHGKDPYMDIKIPVVITKFELNAVAGNHIDLKLNAGNEFFRYGLYYNPSEDEKSFYLTMGFGKNEPSSSHTLNISQQTSSGIQLFKVDLVKMEQLDVKTILFSEEIIQKTGKKGKGIPNLRIKEVKENNDNYYIAGQQLYNYREGLVEIQKSWDIIALRASKSGTESVQTCINTGDQVTVAFGFNSILQDNDYYLAYNSSTFHLLKLNQNLETVNKFEEDTYKNRRCFLDVLQLHQLEKNKYYIYGALFKNGGAALITLD